MCVSVCVSVCLCVRVYFCAMAAVRVRFRYKNYIYSESGDPAECYRHKKLCKNDQLRCAAARGASKHFLHSHGRNFCSILFKFGHDVACSHPKGQWLKQIFQGGPPPLTRGGIAPHFSKILFFSFVVYFQIRGPC